MNIKKLSSNMLKIIASIAMLTDHIGCILFPNIAFLRIIGRISFPIFAFMIAEGCKYTKNKLRYFLCISLSGIIIQAVYYIATGDDYLNIFITLTLSILLIYALPLSSDKYSGFSLFVSALIAVYIMCCYFKVDYGFWGCMLPVFAYISPENNSFKIKLASFSVGLLILSLSLGGIQIYSLLAVPLLFLYDGSRGIYNMKYFFYIFYPTHLAVLYYIKEL